MNPDIDTSNIEDLLRGVHSRMRDRARQATGSSTTEEPRPFRSYKNPNPFKPAEEGTTLLTLTQGRTGVWQLA